MSTPKIGTYFFAHDRDAEAWYGPYATREIAHETGQAEALDNGASDDSCVYTALGARFGRDDCGPITLADLALDAVADDGCITFVGLDCAEDWPEIPQDAHKDLDARLQAVVMAFLEEHGQLPTPFFQMVHDTQEQHPLQPRCPFCKVVCDSLLRCDQCGKNFCGDCAGHGHECDLCKNCEAELAGGEPEAGA